MDELEGLTMGLSSSADRQQEAGKTRQGLHVSCVRVCFDDWSHIFFVRLAEGFHAAKTMKHERMCCLGGPLFDMFGGAASEHHNPKVGLRYVSVEGLL